MTGHKGELPSSIHKTRSVFISIPKRQRFGLACFEVMEGDGAAKSIGLKTGPCHVLTVGGERHLWSVGLRIGGQKR